MSARNLFTVCVFLALSGCSRTPTPAPNGGNNPGTDDVVSMNSPGVIGVSYTGTQMTDAELHEEAKGFAQYPNLASLNLTDTQVSDACMKDIKTLKGLTKLQLRRTEVGDAGLLELKHLTQLEELDLGGCLNVTDDGLVTLKSFKQLTRLRLDASGVTGAGVAELRMALPDCKIER